MTEKRYYGADSPRSTGPHPDPMSEYPYFCTDCNEGRSRLTEDGRCTMCHGARIITYARDLGQPTRNP